jgi:hypothetical protein
MSRAAVVHGTLQRLFSCTRLEPLPQLQGKADCSVDLFVHQVLAGAAQGAHALATAAAAGVPVHVLKRSHELMQITQKH